MTTITMSDEDERLKIDRTDVILFAVFVLMLCGLFALAELVLDLIGAGFDVRAL